MKKFKDFKMADYFDMTPQTVVNYKKHAKDGYRKRYEALKAYYVKEVLSLLDNTNDTNVSKKKVNKGGNYTMDFQRNQVYIYGDISISDIEMIKNHFEGGVTLCINATFKDDNWEWDYDIPLEWS